MKLQLRLLGEVFKKSGVFRVKTLNHIVFVTIVSKFRLYDLNNRMKYFLSTWACNQTWHQILQIYCFNIVVNKRSYLVIQKSHYVDFEGLNVNLVWMHERNRPARWVWSDLILSFFLWSVPPYVLQKHPKLKVSWASKIIIQFLWNNRK